MRFLVEREERERGMVLVFVAGAMIAILTVTAMAIDLGAKRANRAGDQSVADLASLAAGSFLAGNGSATVVPNVNLACQAALNSAVTNVSDFDPAQTTTTTCAVFPADARVGCNEATAPVEVTFSDERHALTIRYPIPFAELADARFADTLGGNDGSSRCERMRVSFSQTQPTGFAAVVGVREQTTHATSVVRATTSQIGAGVAALVLLERVGCGALQNSGQAAVVVRSPSPQNPGVIQSDSAGQVGPCTTNANADGYVVYGGRLPPASGGGPSITAETSSGGVPGVIGIYALGLSTPGRGGGEFPGGLSVAPTRSAIASRRVVDEKYNGAGAQIASLHATAYPLTRWSAATAASFGYSVVTGTQPCRGVGIPAAALLAQRVFLDCTLFEPAVTVFPNATEVVARGPISIRNGNLLSLPNARAVFVRGNGTTAIDVQGKLLLHTAEAVPAAPDPFANGAPCSSRRGPGAGGTAAGWTELATFNGEIWIRGQARMCQTFVYMGRDASTYSQQTVTSSGIAPEGYPALVGCSSAQPCPKDGVDASWPIRVTGGGAIVDWSAPNRLATQPTAADFATNPFEDLALWSETSSTMVEMKGQAGSLSEGLFFLPNASALFQGQGAQPIQLNAQFIVRRLNLSGQGSLTLSPNAADAVLSQIPGAVAIIR